MTKSRDTFFFHLKKWMRKVHLCKKVTFPVIFFDFPRVRQNISGWDHVISTSTLANTAHFKLINKITNKLNSFFSKKCPLNGKSSKKTPKVVTTIGSVKSFYVVWGEILSTWPGPPP